MAPLVFQLSGTCNNYPWGKKGKQSLAAKLCSQTPGVDFTIKDDEYYSEMWFGDYPDFPARVLETGEPLKDMIQKNKEQLLGPKVVKNFDGQLPFLPKILSIAKALPLQLHPNKELATKLHKEDPDNFTDPNHKPEIAVALSKFEVFAGFKPLSQIEPLFKLNPLKQFGGDTGEAWTDEMLRSITRKMLETDLDTVARTQYELSQLSKADLGEASYILDLLPRLQSQYSASDAGNLVALLCMNYLVFEAGDAIYIPADGIHAYLSGDIVECMARSNNVLNVGFCPPADRNNVDMFANTLTFKSHSREDVYLPSEKYERSKEGRTVIYKPPLSEFDMLRVDLEKGQGDELRGNEGPGTMIVTKGQGTLVADGKEFELKEGYIFYISPGVPIQVRSEGQLQAYVAFI